MSKLKRHHEKKSNDMGFGAKLSPEYIKDVDPDAEYDRVKTDEMAEREAFEKAGMDYPDTNRFP